MRLIKIGIQDVFRNYFFLPTLIVMNLVYCGIQLLPFTVYEDLLWRYEAFYVVAIVLLIIPLMYTRFSERNREIILTVIYPKLLKKYGYNLSYYLIIGGSIFMVFLSIASVISIFAEIDVTRNLMFGFHLLTVTLIGFLLYINIFMILKNYFFSIAVYLMGIFGLILINAPNSYLWFDYQGNQWDVKLWIGKGIIIILLLIIICGQKIYIGRFRT